MHNSYRFTGCIITLC